MVPCAPTGLAWLAPETFAVCHTGVTIGQPLDEDAQGGGGDDDEREVVLQTVTIAEISSDSGATVTKVVSAHADRKRVGTADTAAQFCVRIPDWDYYSKWKSNANPMTDELKSTIESYFTGGAVDVEPVSAGLGVHGSIAAVAVAVRGGDSCCGGGGAWRWQQ